MSTVHYIQCAYLGTDCVVAFVFSGFSSAASDDKLPRFLPALVFLTTTEGLVEVDLLLCVNADCAVKHSLVVLPVWSTIEELIAVDLLLSVGAD